MRAALIGIALAVLLYAALAAAGIVAWPGQGW